MKPHIIRQGDYTTKLAHRMGFSADEVWNHPKNQELRASRSDMDILAPGDILYVPETERTPLSIRAGVVNRYVARVPRVSVNLVLRDGDQVLAGEPYRVEGVSPPIVDQSSAEGIVAFEVSIHVREVQLVLPRRKVVHAVRIGDMDPVQHPSGVRKRLMHLGFLPWLDEVAVESDLSMAAGPFELVQRLARAATTREAMIPEAIEAFQRASHLTPTGALDDATRAALEKAHGS